MAEAKTNAQRIVEKANIPIKTYTYDADSFADGVTVKADGNKLQSLSPGTTYILVRNGEDKIWAYKVIVRG